MKILVSCACGKRFKVNSKFAGKAGKCPTCGKTVRVLSPTQRQHDGGKRRERRSRSDDSGPQDQDAAAVRDEEPAEETFQAGGDDSPSDSYRLGDVFKPTVGGGRSQETARTIQCFEMLGGNIAEVEQYAREWKRRQREQPGGSTDNSKAMAGGMAGLAAAVVTGDVLPIVGFLAGYHA